MRLLCSLSLLALTGCFPEEDGPGEVGPFDTLTWTEQRTITVEAGCTFTVRGDGVEVTNQSPELRAKCPSCDHIFEIEADQDIVCEDVLPLQVVSPYYRGTTDIDGDVIEIYFGELAPTYAADAFTYLAAVDNTGHRMPYTYSGDLGVEGGAYTVDAAVIIE